MKIIIVGGSGSIGSALALELKNQGYEPHLIARNEDRLESIAQKIKCNYSVANVLDYKNLEIRLKEIGNEVVGIAYCVGSINLKPLKMTKINDFLESYEINTIGAIKCIKILNEVLEMNKGSILLYSTIAVKQGFANHSIVSSAKGALEGLTLSLAAEFAPNIRVNCIAPSLTESNLSKKIISNPTIKSAIEKMHPIPKIGEGEDFSKIGSFLLSKKNKWITGQILHIDGGRSTLRIKA